MTTATRAGLVLQDETVIVRPYAFLPYAYLPLHKPAADRVTVDCTSIGAGTPTSGRSLIPQMWWLGSQRVEVNGRWRDLTNISGFRRSFTFVSDAAGES